MHRRLSAPRIGFVDDIVVDKHKIVQELYGEGARIKAGSAFFTKTEISDDKKDRSYPFALSGAEVINRVKKERRKSAKAVSFIQGVNKVFQFTFDSIFYFICHCFLADHPSVGAY